MTTFFHSLTYLLTMCRIGGAKVLLVGVALWSLGTLVAPPAAKISLLALCASRVFVSVWCPLAHCRCVIHDSVCGGHWNSYEATK